VGILAGPTTGVHEEMEGDAKKTDLYGIVGIGCETRFLKIPAGTSELQYWVYDANIER